MVIWTVFILGEAGAVSRVAGIFVGESRKGAKVYCKNETNPLAITLTEPVPEAFGQKNIFLFNFSFCCLL